MSFCFLLLRRYLWGFAVRVRLAACGLYMACLSGSRKPRSARRSAACTTNVQVQGCSGATTYPVPCQPQSLCQRVAPDQRRTAVSLFLLCTVCCAYVYVCVRHTRDQRRCVALCVVRLLRSCSRTATAAGSQPKPLPQPNYLWRAEHQSYRSQQHGKGNYRNALAPDTQVGAIRRSCRGREASGGCKAQCVSEDGR